MSKPRKQRTLRGIRETLCKHCDHFVIPNENYTPTSGFAKYLHMEDGAQDFDHDAEPGATHRSEVWSRLRPDLTQVYPDGKVGPNSIHHHQRGKVL